MFFFGIIIKFSKFLKMTFLIFFNSNYSLFSELFYLRPPYMIFLELLDFGSFGKIFEFLKFLKMLFLIFFNSIYWTFFIWGLYIWLFEFLNFWLLGVFWVIFYFLKFLKMLFLIFFNSNYSLFTELFWVEASLCDF